MTNKKHNVKKTNELYLASRSMTYSSDITQQAWVPVSAVEKLAGERDIYADTSKIKRMRILLPVCFLLLVMAVSAPFIHSAFFAHRIGLVTESGGGRLAAGSFVADAVNELSIHFDNGSVRIVLHNEDVISVRASGFRTMNYNFDADSGALTLSSVVNNAATHPSHAALTVYLPRDAQIGHIDNLYIRAFGRGGNNDITISGGDFGNLQIAALNGSVNLRDSSVGGHITASGRYGVTARNFSFDDNAANIRSSMGVVDIR